MFAFFCTLLDERSVVDKHRFYMAVKFGVFADEDLSKLPMLYWLLSFNKKPIRHVLLLILVHFLLLSCLWFCLVFVMLSCASVY